MLNRFVIPTIEGRIFTGITMFVAVMILIGWVAINEPGRMDSFSKQHTGRSIERGAELFAASCSTCHGADGLGQGDRAPALDNPMLFGFDFLSESNGQILPLERRLNELNVQLTELETERTALTTEAGSADLTDARRQEINTRLAEIDVITGVEGDTAIAPKIASLQAELAPLYVARDTAIDGLQGAIDKGYLPELDAKRAEGGLAFTNYLIQDSNRLAQVGWGSDVSNYIRTTLIHGRPGSDKVWPQPMVAWSQRGGGPLRDDELDDIVAFILNYNKGDNWTVEDLMAVNQFGKLHGGGTSAPAVPPIGNDPAAALAIVDTLVGDPTRGEALYMGDSKTETGDRLGCKSCHVGAAQAPDTLGTWDRVEADRLTQPQFAGYTPQHYIIESILQPDAFVVSGYAGGLMPHELGTKLSPKDLADVVAYLHSTSPNYVAPDPSTITPLTVPGAAPVAPAAGTTEATTEAPSDAGSTEGSVESASGDETTVTEALAEATVAATAEATAEATSSN